MDRISAGVLDMCAFIALISVHHLLLPLLYSRQHHILLKYHNQVNTLSQEGHFLPPRKKKQKHVVTFKYTNTKILPEMKTLNLHVGAMLNSLYLIDLVILEMKVW